MSVNKVILIGNLGSDPDIRYMPNGNAVASLRLATTKRYKNNEGEQKEKTEWHRVIFFNKPAETIVAYTKKGSRLYVEGELRTRKWQGQDGKDNYTTEIVGSVFDFLDKKPENKPATNQQPPSVPEHDNFSDYDDDADIPF